MANPFEPVISSVPQTLHSKRLTFPPPAALRLLHALSSPQQPVIQIAPREQLRILSQSAPHQFHSIAAILKTILLPEPALLLPSPTVPPAIVHSRPHPRRSPRHAHSPNAG